MSSVRVGHFSDSFQLPQHSAQGLAQGWHHNLCVELPESKGHVGNMGTHPWKIIHIHSGNLLPPLHELHWPTARAQHVSLAVLAFISA